MPARSREGGSNTKQDEAHPASSPVGETAEDVEGSKSAPAVSENFADISDGELRHVDPRWIVARRISACIFNGFIIVLILVVLAVQLIAGRSPGALVPGAMLIALLCWLAATYPRWQYEHTQYAISAAGMEIRRGVFWRSIIDVPRSRIQHTDVTQGPLGRRFDIATLTMYTAGTAHASVQLAGLEHQRALRIRNFLIRGGEQDGV